MKDNMSISSLVVAFSPYSLRWGFGERDSWERDCSRDEQTMYLNQGAIDIFIICRNKLKKIERLSYELSIRKNVSRTGVLLKLCSFQMFFFLLIDKISLRVKSSSCFFCIIKSTSFNFNLDPKNGIVDSIPSLCSLSGGHDTIERSR